MDRARTRHGTAVPSIPYMDTARHCSIRFLKHRDTGATSWVASHALVIVIFIIKTMTYWDMSTLCHMKRVAFVYLFLELCKLREQKTYVFFKWPVALSG